LSLELPTNSRIEYFLDGVPAGERDDYRPSDFYILLFVAESVSPDGLTPALD